MDALPQVSQLLGLGHFQAAVLLLPGIDGVLGHSHLPSHFFHRNVFLSFQEDGLGIRDREIIGVDVLMWGSDYPHTESTFPQSRLILDRILDGVPDAERRKITSTNAVSLYGFDLG